MPLFFAMFKTLEGKTIQVELKNSLQIRGRLVSIDQYLNMKLDDIEIVDKANFPQLVRAAWPPAPLACNWERLAAAARPPHRLPTRTPPHHPPPHLARPRSSLCAPSLCAAAWCATCSCPPRRWTLTCCRTPLEKRRQRRPRASDEHAAQPPPPLSPYSLFPYSPLRPR